MAPDYYEAQFWFQLTMGTVNNFYTHFWRFGERKEICLHPYSLNLLLGHGYDVNLPHSNKIIRDPPPIFSNKDGPGGGQLDVPPPSTTTQYTVHVAVSYGHSSAVGYHTSNLGGKLGR